MEPCVRIHLATSALLALGCNPGDFDRSGRQPILPEADASSASQMSAADAALDSKVESVAPSAIDSATGSAPQPMADAPRGESGTGTNSNHAGDRGEREVGRGAEQGMSAPEPSTIATDASMPARPALSPDSSMQPLPASADACVGRLADPMRCGCSDDCAASHATAACVDGHCLHACEAGFADCNTDLARAAQGDGCETDVRNDDTRCGSCEQRCSAEFGSYVACENAVCTPIGATPIQLTALGRCLDVRGPDERNGTPAQIWSCGDRLPQQEWVMTAAGDLRGFANKCLDVRGPSSRNGTPVQIWDCVRAPQQTWSLNARGQLVGLDGKCLQVVGGASADGQAVELWDCLDIPAQHWTAREVR